MSAISKEISQFEDCEFSNKVFIDRGQYGEVHRVTHGTLGVLAVKYVLKKPGYSNNDIKQEIEQLSKCCNHEHIVMFHGKVVKQLNDETIMGYVMEYMEDDSLHGVIHNSAIAYGIVDVASWGRQAASGLEWLHSQNIIHRDVKPLNMLLTKSRKTLKICDFGCSRNIIPFSMTLGVGTLMYMAPELLSEKGTGKYSMNCDVYSMGISLWEMITRRIPYDEFKGSIFAVKAWKDHITKSGILPLALVTDENLRNIIRHCLSLPAAQRTTTEELHRKLRHLHLESLLQFPSENVSTVKNDYQWIYAFSFNPKKDMMTTKLPDERYVRLWSLNATEHVLRTPEEYLLHSQLLVVSTNENTAIVISVAWNNEGTLLATGDNHGNLLIWTFNGELKTTAKIDETDIRKMTWSPKDEYIVMTVDNWAIVWDNISEKQLGKFKVHSNIVSLVWVDGVTFSTWSKELIEVFHIGSSKPIRTFNFRKRGVKVLFNYSSKMFVAWCYSPQCVMVFSLTEGTTWRKEFKSNVLLNDVVWSPLPNRLIITTCASYGINPIQTWDVRQNKLLSSFDDRHIWSCMAVSPNGLYLASGSLGHNISIWNIQNGVLLHNYKGFEGKSVIIRLEWNRGGDKIVAVDYVGTIVLLDVSHIARGETDYSSLQPKKFNDRETREENENDVDDQNKNDIRKTAFAESKSDRCTLM